MSNELVLTELQCQARIREAMLERDRRIAALESELRDAEFRAAVAEWAVAGVIASKVEVRTQISDMALERAQDPVFVARRAGQEAGAYLLERANLHFKNHAENYQLKARLPCEYLVTPHTVECHPEGWPRPYAR